jgi:hypothetical protein
MNICSEIISYNDKLYLVYRKLKENRVKEEYLNKISEAWFCDLVLKSKTQETSFYLFLREIEEAVLD